MKAIKLLFLICWPFLSNSQSTDTLLYERFETGGTSFTLNTSDLGGASAATGYNQWIVNNAYTGGSGQLICLGLPFNFNVTNTSTQPVAIAGGTNTNYMHIVSDAAQAGGINNCNYLASDGICNLDENNFTRMTQDVTTVGYDSVSFSFLWICAGGTNIHGELYYSTDSGISWTIVSTPVSQYKNQSSWTQQSVSLPVFAQQSTLRFGFRFVNQQSNSANDPGFGIDEVLITGSIASPAPVAAFTTSNSEICAGECVDFFDMSSGTPTTWLWIFQGASTSFSNQQNPTQICYSTPGTYTTTLIVTNAAGTDTLTSTAIVVHANPPAPVITLSNDTLYTTSGYQAYQWFLNGNAIAGAVDYFYEVVTDGSYTVAVFDTNGCSSVSDSLNFTTGIKEYSDLSTFIFPVPAMNDLYLIHDAEPINELNIYNREGKKIMALRDAQIKTPVDVSFLSSGIYLLQIRTVESREKVFKFIKQ